MWMTLIAPEGEGGEISNRLLDFPHIWSVVAGIGIGIRAVSRQRTADDVPPSLVSFVDDEDGVLFTFQVDRKIMFISYERRFSPQT